MNYSELTKKEQVLFNKIEKLFLDNDINNKEFVTTLAVLINKHKLKGGKGGKKKNNNISK